MKFKLKKNSNHRGFLILKLMSEIFNKTTPLKNLSLKAETVSADSQLCNVTRDRKSCQALFNAKVQPLTNVTSNPIKFFNSISKGQRKIFYLLLWCDYRFLNETLDLLSRDVTREDS